MQIIVPLAEALRVAGGSKETPPLGRTIASLNEATFAAARSLYAAARSASRSPMLLRAAGRRFDRGPATVLTL